MINNMWHRGSRYFKDCLTNDADSLTDKLAVLKSVLRVIA